MIRKMIFAIVGILLGTSPIPGIATLVHAQTPNDVIVVAQDLTDVISVDPHYAFGNTDVEIPGNLYDRLVNVDPEDLSKIAPGVAERWEVSDEGTTIRFLLNEGLKFHSGNPVTAEDVAFSLKRIMLLDAIVINYPLKLGWTKDNIGEAVTVVDSHTVDLKLFEPLNIDLALQIIATPMGSVLDQQLVMEHEQDGDMGREWLKTHSAGSGPFHLASYNPTQGLLMEANPDFRLGPPRSRQIYIRNVQEPSSQRLLLETGDADIARNLSGDQLDTIRKSGKVNVQVDPKYELISLHLNNANPILAHPKVQEAIRWLIDYRGMEQTFLQNTATVAQTFWPFDDRGIPNIYSLDVEKAKTLLREAGYADGFNVELAAFNSEPWSQMAQSIQATMAQAGIQVDIFAGDRRTVFGKHRSRSFDMVIHSNTSEYQDPDARSGFFWSPDVSDEANLVSSFAWRANWRIPDLSIVADVAKVEKDPELRNRLYRALQYSLQQSSPMIFMFMRNHQTGIAKNVQGYKPLPVWGNVPYYGVYKE